ncbi:MAG: hypothetical protein AAFU80_04445 [Pseudomonadota bacterium]
MSHAEAQAGQGVGKWDASIARADFLARMLPPDLMAPFFTANDAQATFHDEILREAKT